MTLFLSSVTWASISALIERNACALFSFRAAFLDRLANACTGLRARVVYSRLFPDWTPDRTGPQTGRLQRVPVACSGARSVWSAASPDTAGEFGERYGTGSGSDLVDSEVVAYKAPGRYRSLYRTNSPAVSGLAALQTLRAPEHATGNRCKRRGGSNEAPCEMFTRARGAGDQARVNNSRHIFTQQNFYPVAYAGQYSTWRSL